jgi:hypothetical protein
LNGHTEDGREGDAEMDDKQNIQMQLKNIEARIVKWGEMVRVDYG